jgi:hypothetical protein
MSLIDPQSASYCGHSANVMISLLFNGHSLPVAQLGPGFVLLDDPGDHPPCDARLEKGSPIRAGGADDFTEGAIFELCKTRVLRRGSACVIHITDHCKKIHPPFDTNPRGSEGRATEENKPRNARVLHYCNGHG